MRIEIEVESVKMLREQLCLAQFAVNHDEDWKGVHTQEDVSGALSGLIRELDRHRPIGPDGKHGNKHTATCGCEHKAMGLDIRNYVGVFFSASTGRQVLTSVEAVQWDGTEKHAEELADWVGRAARYQGLEYFAVGDKSLHVDEPFLVLGVGNDFGDFDIATKGDYIYLTHKHFDVTSGDKFETQYTEIE